MSEKTYNTRIIHKHDTEENWNKAVNFIPKVGELIVYDADENYNYSRVKMGDGTNFVIDLPFIGEEKANKDEAGAIDIDLDGSNEGEANPVNADTLGGLSAEEYIMLINNYINQKVPKAPPRNLLVNSDFRNPVNQRGLKSLIANGSSYQYFLDRWCHADFSGTPATFTLTDEGMAVLNGTGYFYQRYEKGHLKSNTAYTLAIYYADGTLDIRQKAYPTFVVSVANENYDQLYFTIDAGKTVSKAALYEGVYTSDNLPEYQPKGYGAELAECQRYYQTLFVGGCKVGTATAGGTYQDNFPHPKLRLNNATVAYNPVYNYNNVVTSVSVSEKLNGLIAVVIKVNAATYEYIGEVTLSADL